MCGTRLELDPCIPRAWAGFSITFRHRTARYDIIVENPHGVSRGVAAVELDGEPIDGTAGVALSDDGKVHRVRVVLGAGK